MINCFPILFFGKHVYLLFISRHFCIKFQNFTEVIDETENATHQVDTPHVERNVVEQGKIRKRKLYLNKDVFIQHVFVYLTDPENYSRGGDQKCNHSNSFG